MSPSKIDFKELPAQLIARAKGIAEKRADQILVGSMAVLLAIVGYLYYSESTAPVPEVTPPPPVKIKQVIKPGATIVQDVEKMGQPLADIGDTTLSAILQINMFDAKAAKSAEEVARQAREKINQAQRAFEGGNLREARTLAQEALEMDKMLTSAKEMITSINEKLGDSAKEAPKPEGEGTPEAG